MILSENGRFLFFSQGNCFGEALLNTFLYCPFPSLRDMRDLPLELFESGLIFFIVHPTQISPM
jgi:hypothetical protein